jgi:hypothetical protein
MIPNRAEKRAEIKQLIDHDGFSVMFSRKSKTFPAYAYTIGLFHNCNHPEMIVIGYLESEFMIDFLRSRASRVTTERLREVKKVTGIPIISRLPDVYTDGKYKFNHTEGDLKYKKIPDDVNLLGGKDDTEERAAPIGISRISEEWRQKLFKYAHQLYITTSTQKYGEFEAIQLSLPDNNLKLFWEDGFESEGLGLKILTE